MFKFRLWINRLLQSGMWGYLVVLSIAIVVLALIVTVASLVEESVWWNIFYALGINPVDDTSPHTHTWLYLLLGVGGALVFGGLMVTVFTSGVERYVEQVKEGQIRYRRLRGHVIIIGWNHTTVSLIGQVCHKHPHSKVLLFSSASPLDVRAELVASLDPKDEHRVIIYATGNHRPDDQLEDLCFHSAVEVYITLEEDDKYPQQFAQLTILAPISQLAAGSAHGRSMPLRINLMVSDVESYSALQRLGLPKEYYCSDDGKQTLDIHIFNFYENWARLLWGYGGSDAYDPLDFEPMEGTDKHVHLVIVGFGDMGQALLMEAIRICHYPNGQQTLITVVDPQADELKERLYAQVPGLQAIADIGLSFVSAKVEAAPVRALLEQWACDRNKLLTLAVCIPNPDEALQAALSLPEPLFYQRDLCATGPLTATKHRLVENRNRTRVLVRQAVENSPQAIIPSLQYPNLRIFGTSPDGVNVDLLSDELAITINGLYWDNILGTATNADIASRRQAWHQLWFDINKTPESSKVASRYQADRFRSLIAILRRNDISRNPGLLEQLAESEHRRWMAERILAGWRGTRAGEHRVDELKLHSSIVPYSELPEGEKEKDRNVITFAASIA